MLLLQAVCVNELAEQGGTELDKWAQASKRAAAGDTAAGAASADPPQEAEAEVCSLMPKSP